MQECVQQAWFRYPSNHRRYPLPHAIFQRWSIPYQKYTRYPCGECHTVLQLSFIPLYINTYIIFPSSIHLGIAFYTTLHYTHILVCMSEWSASTAWSVRVGFAATKVDRSCQAPSLYGHGTLNTTPRWPLSWHTQDGQCCSNVIFLVCDTLSLLEKGNWGLDNVLMTISFLSSVCLCVASTQPTWAQQPCWSSWRAGWGCPKRLTSLVTPSSSIYPSCSLITSLQIFFSYTKSTTGPSYIFLA